MRKSRQSFGRYDNGHLTGRLCFTFYEIRKGHHSIKLNISLSLSNRLFGIGGSLLRLLSSYLTNRVQCVKLNIIMSASLPVTSGVPQGSVLGPLLFLIFINDLPTQVSHSKTFLYADDLKFIHNNLLEMQNDIIALSQWSQVNKLSFNAKKTQLISFDFRSQHCITVIPVLILDDHEIQGLQYQYQYQYQKSILGPSIPIPIPILSKF